MKRISGHSVVFGGEKHQGWLPKGAVTPEAKLKVELRLELQIREGEGGFLLEWRPMDEAQGQRKEVPFAGDLWFESLEEAEQAATHDFGVSRVDWEAAS